MQLRRQTVPSSVKLSSLVSVSQQTASRWLSELVTEGFVERKTGAYRLTKNGEVYLNALVGAIHSAVTGKVFTGLGEGRYYLSKPGYRRQFVSLLGFMPYPGTLNLRVTDPSSRRSLLTLRAQSGIPVAGFVDKDRTFGGARCYPVKIQGKVEAAVIVPERTHYPDDVVELLSPVFLRKALNLSDGDEVRVE